MKRNVILLLLSAILIYGIQLLVFKDPSTTGFYILQDLAFLPVSIAVATVVVGEYINEKEKKERQEKTQMLCSSFFTEIGNELLQEILPLADEKEKIREIFESKEVTDQKSLDELRAVINDLPVHINLNAETYEKIERIITGNREILLVVSSNPLLLDHADFTKMLWGLFHLIDEFRLRGEYDVLSKADKAHVETDFAEVLKLLLINWSRNRLFTKKNYPNYYGASLKHMMNAKGRSSCQKPRP